MELIKLLNCEVPENYNGGQAKECKVHYTLTGKICKANNIPCTVAADCLDIQIKSARATVCYGLDIIAHMKKDAAKRYAYVTNNDYMFVMSPIEYIDFIRRFSVVSFDAKSRGGRIKLRLGHESKKMLGYLMSQVA